ncbi:uncharacterized protein LOC143887745 [Tasmannia lanceolata]|uniref:uncharacterized protein LOC143887745 n=1 Tax=Tasmannia lanceolata TaxID=3420 RepID=UPI0040639A71
MPFPMKIQPIDSSFSSKESIQNDHVKPVVKSRLKRLFERQFPSVLRISEKIDQHASKDSGSESEPSSVCLAKMVQNFIEENNDKQSAMAKCGRNRCNCFNGNCNESSDDEFDFNGDALFPATSGEACEILKSFVPCGSISEQNLLADISKIVEKNKICKCKEESRNIVTTNLLSLGYDASICKSRWEKSPSFPSGEYEYVDVIIEGERLIIDIDFRSEFEIARSTKNYRSILQTIPSIFVGKPDRLQQIVTVVSEAAKQSLNKKGLHFPPWRKPEYMRAKWISPYKRITNEKSIPESEIQTEKSVFPCQISTGNFSGEFEFHFGEKNTPKNDSGSFKSFPAENSCEEEKITVVISPWQLPAVKPKVRTKVVTGLASVLREKP